VQALRRAWGLETLPGSQNRSRQPRALLPPQGSTPTVIDLTSDDTPSNKGKQKMDVETVGASNQPGTSAAAEDDMAEASARWPNFVELSLMRTEEELPR
jgi:hypothetical protein